jgi:hypothetical protein
LGIRAPGRKAITARVRAKPRRETSYTLHSDGKQLARGMHSIQAIKEAGGWRVTGIIVQAESATAPLPKEYLP